MNAKNDTLKLQVCSLLARFRKGISTKFKRKSDKSNHRHSKKLAQHKSEKKSSYVGGVIKKAESDVHDLVLNKFGSKFEESKEDGYKADAKHGIDQRSKKKEK